MNGIGWAGTEATSMRWANRIIQIHDKYVYVVWITQLIY